MNQSDRSINYRKANKWQLEFEKLRTIILDFPLTEEVKWG